jgi:hypothetical protein
MAGRPRLIVRFVCAKVEEVSVFRVQGLDVNLAMAFPNHVLLDRFDCPSLRVAVKTFAILKYDKVEISDQGFQIHNQIADILDEESMAFSHVVNAVIESS